MNPSLLHPLCITVAVSLLIAPAAAAEPPPSEPLDPVAAADSVASFVDRKSEEIRAKLADEFRHVDRERLLQMKETVDTFLSTFMLFDDAATLPGWKWWSLPAEEFREGNTPEWRAEGTGGPPSELPVSANSPRAFAARLTWYAPCGEDHPVMMWASGIVSPGAGEVRVGHYEPYLSNRSLAFPLHPERLIVRWDATRLQLLDRDGARPLAEERAGQRDHIFNNPEYTYAIFDTLRAKLRGGNHVVPPARWTGRPSNAAWDVTVGSSRPSRSVRRIVSGDAMRLEIDQHPVLLLHQSPVTFELRRDYADGRSAAELHVPSTEVEYLEGGREVAIESRAGRDGWFPRSVDVSASGTRLFEARMEPFPADRGEDARDIGDILHGLDEIYLAIDRGTFVSELREHPIERFDNAGPHARRAMLKHNVFLSLLRRDVDGLAAWLDEYRAMLEAEGVPLAFHVYNIEAVAQTASDAIDPGLGARIVTTLLRREYERTQPAELAEHAARLVSQFRLGPALVALDALARSADPGRAAWAVAFERSLSEAWRAGEIKPGSQYPYADLSERLTVAVMATRDQLPSRPPHSKESVR